MRRITIDFETTTEAFQGDGWGEVVRILRDLADTFEQEQGGIFLEGSSPDEYVNICDCIGNLVGVCTVAIGGEIDDDEDDDEDDDADAETWSDGDAPPLADWTGPREGQRRITVEIDSAPGGFQADAHDDVARVLSEVADQFLTRRLLEGANLGEREDTFNVRGRRVRIHKGEAAGERFDSPNIGFCWLEYDENGDPVYYPLPGADGKRRISLRIATGEKWIEIVGRFSGETPFAQAVDRCMDEIRDTYLLLEPEERGMAEWPKSMEDGA